MTFWDPFGDLFRIEGEMNRMFDDFWRGGLRGRRQLAAPGRAGVPAEREETLVGVPNADLIDRKDALVIRAEIPGVSKENIKVDVTDERISISAKMEREKEEKKEDYYWRGRTYGAWQRSFPLPVRVKSEKAKASYKDGILEVTLPKTEEEKKKKRELKIE